METEPRGRLGLRVGYIVWEKIADCQSKIKGNIYICLWNVLDVFFFFSIWSEK